ncbi:hypothetical protein [Arenicella xantha]|uniref:Uncharacterized protein n=1 Tax=Arenicella xantha TaxID=644221 RepID=A0A395JIS4_9GAMM|nr:hypothetical protein [Arenicella xantha]RBP50612.1 hypothetical protein DFR28_10223 [Arenicella xantha]
MRKCSYYLVLVALLGSIGLAGVVLLEISPTTDLTLPLTHSLPLTAKSNQSPPSSELESGAKSSPSEFVKVPDWQAFIADLNAPYGFAIEPIGNRLIWSSSGDATFKTANQDGSQVTSLLSNFENPFELLVESSFGHTRYLYLDGAIQVQTVDTELDTRDDRVLLNLPSQPLHGMGFDEATNTLYLGDQYGRPALAIDLSANTPPFIKKITLINIPSQEK